jgi:PAS domain S-box-containing protein
MDGLPETARVRSPGRLSASWAALEWFGLGAVLLLFAGYTALELRSSRAEIEDLERGRMAHQARIVEQMLGTRLQATSNALDALRADVPALLAKEDGISLLNERMNVMVSSMAGVRTFILVNRAGLGIASNRKELIGLDFREGDRYRTIRSRPDASALYVSAPFMTPLRNWAVSLGRAILDGEGRFDGYILAIIDPDYFNLLLDSTRYAPDMSAALIHGGGLIIYRVPESTGAVGMNLAERPDALFHRHIRSGVDTTSWTGTLQTSGKEALIVFQTIRPSKVASDGFLIASFSRETDALLAPWRKELRDRIIVLLVVSLAACLGLFFHQRRRTAAARAEAALRESEARYRTLVTGMSAGLILQRADGVLVASNPAAERILGLTADQMQGRRSTDPEWRPMREDGTHFPGEEHAPMVALRTGKAQTDAVMALHKPDGTVTWVSIDSEPLRDDAGKVYAVLSTFVDISKLKVAEAERNRLQGELAHTARLAAMGTLVAGVAHEINNPLAAELAGQGTALEIVREARRRLAERITPPLQEQIRSLDEAIEALSDAQEGGERVARIVRDLATFANPDPHRSRLRLAEVVVDAMRWLPATIAGSATVEVEDRGTPEILASRGQLAQVIVNLVTNAAKATRAGERGKIVVRTGSGDAATAYVEVTDDGVGIGPAVIDRIFDPFFTTRATGEGRGSGLGLAISRSIVEAHGGTITVRSDVGKGSTFRVELPAAPAG